MVGVRPDGTNVDALGSEVRFWGAREEYYGMPIGGNHSVIQGNRVRISKDTIAGGTMRR